jgi:proliferating cell nuclear antigen
MDFVATLDNSKVLRSIIEAISFLIEETYVHIDPAGIKMNAIDGNHVAMLLATLPKDMFVEYKCTEEFKIGINVNDFIKILRRAKGDDQVQLIHNTDDKRTIIIKMKSDRSTRTFKLKSKEIQGYDAKEEGLLESFEESLKDKFTASIKLEGGVIEEIVKDALIISDLLKIEVQAAEKVVSFKASDESGEVEVELDLGGAGVIDSEVKGDAVGLYSLNFLDNIIKIQSIIDVFQLTIGNNIPMKISGTYSAGGGEGGTEGRIVYLLAPRVEDENESDYDEDSDVDEMEDSLEDQKIEDSSAGDEDEDQ